MASVFSNPLVKSIPKPSNIKMIQNYNRIKSYLCGMPVTTGIITAFLYLEPIPPLVTHHYVFDSSITKHK